MSDNSNYENGNIKLKSTFCKRFHIYAFCRMMDVGKLLEGSI